MTELTVVQIEAPYLILLGDIQGAAFAKTGLGIVQWRPHLVAGQLRFAGCNVDLGVPDLTVTEAVDAGVKSLIIGVAPIGGAIPQSWLSVIEEAAWAGMDIVSGLHYKLAEIPGLIAASQGSGARLIDVRKPPANLPVGTGKKRTGKRILMVATDCAIGKKYTALALDRCMREAGMKATFRATGQTGIILAGEGLPIDSVVADFISGAAELVSPDNEEDHWDVIEGQGSLFHPAYSGVSLGLLHGSQPDAFVVCYHPTRTAVNGWEHYTLPSLRECIDQHVMMGQRTNADIQCVGISVNTSDLPADTREAFLTSLSAEMGLPCADPLIDGCGAIVEHIRSIYE